MRDNCLPPGPNAVLAGARRRAPESPWTHQRWLAAAGLLLAPWAAIPPYVDPSLRTAGRVEVADHVVPAVVATVSFAMLTVWTRADRMTTWMLGAGLVVVLAGLWMTLTHVPLVAQAAMGQVPWRATVLHGVPCLAMLGFWAFSAKSHWDLLSGPDECERVDE